MDAVGVVAAVAVVADAAIVVVVRVSGPPVSGLVSGWPGRGSWAYCGVWLRKLEVLNNN